MRFSQCGATATTLAALPVGRMIDELPCAFYVIDESGRLIMWNHQLEQALETPGHELANRNVLVFFDEKIRPAIVEKIADAVRTGYSSIDAELVGKFGKRTIYAFRWARTELAGRPSIFGTGVDITATKLNERGLEVRERALYASVNAIVITCCDGDDNRIEYVNPAFEKMTGYTMDEVRGRDPRFMQIPGTDTHEQRRLHDAISSRRSISTVLRNRRKNGAVFWNELRIDPVTNRDGEVTHFVGVLNDVTETRHYERRLHHLAHHDPLTGLANRTLLVEQLKLAIADAVACERTGALAFLDLDNFKRINDTFGHDVGDLVLSQIAMRLRASVRDEDVVARFGGDEFVLLIREQPSISHIAELLERICVSIRTPVQFADGEVVPGTSIGVSIFPNDGQTVDQVMRAADAAMYHAKALGKNNVQFYAADMARAMREHLLLQDSLRQAIDNHELELKFQPKLCLHSGRIIGAEALIRWRRGDEPAIEPDQFIPLAEETGLIVPLGDWVLNEACKVLHSLEEAGIGDLVISVNLSARQLRQRRFASALADILAVHSVAPARLELEVTESQLMDQPEDARSALAQLKSLGVRISIDDFGTGYSSLSHLRNFPVDYIKIDKSFLVDLSADEHEVLPRAIIDLGHNLHLQVIAEGVETEEQLAFLRKHGCDQMQGFYFSPAIAPDQLQTMLVNKIQLYGEHTVQ